MTKEIRSVEGFEDVLSVLSDAYARVSVGKGHQRHSAGRPFSEQPIMTIGRRRIGFAVGQAEKKLDEADRLPRDRARNEYLDAINYLVAAVLLLDERTAQEEKERRHTVIDAASGGQATVRAGFATEVPHTTIEEEVRRIIQAQQEGKFYTKIGTNNAGIRDHLNQFLQSNEPPHLQVRMPK